MARILLLTDFSDDSFHAACYAARILGTEGNTFRVVHAWSDEGMIGTLMPAYGDLVQVWQEDLDGFVSRIQHAGINVEGQALLYGTLSTVMDEVVEQESIDLVVMARHRSGNPLLFGNSTLEVVRRGHAPVLIVPGSIALQPPARIALADDHQPVSVAELDILRLIARRNRSGIIVLHVQEGQEEAIPSTHTDHDRGLVGVPRTYRTLIGKDIAQSLMSFLSTDGADMLVVAHRHLGLLRRLFEPSVTIALARRSELPLLVLPQPRNG